MSTTSSAHLLYGYFLGGGEGGWHLKEADENGEWHPDWIPQGADDIDDDMILGRIIQATTGIGGDPHPELWTSELDWEQIVTDPRYQRHQAWADGWRDARDALGIRVHTVGGYGSTERVLTIVERDPDGRETFPLSVDWSDTAALDLRDLHATALTLGWEDTMREAVTILGVTPVTLDGFMWREETVRTPVPPSFLLAASYG